MKETFITLHRKLLYWRWFKKPEMVSIFIYLLLRANFEDAYFFDVQIKRGELATSIDAISKDTGLSFQKVRTCLKRLQKTGEINMKATNKFSVITLINYDTYQTNNKKTTSKTKSTNKQLTTSNNINNNTIKEFYQSQIRNNKNEPYIDKYITLTDMITGKVGDGFDSIMNMEQQLSYKQFVTCLGKAQSKKQKLISIVQSMDNWKGIEKRNKSVSLTIQKWLDKC